MLVLPSHARAVVLPTAKSLRRQTLYSSLFSIPSRTLQLAVFSWSYISWSYSSTICHQIEVGMVSVVVSLQLCCVQTLAVFISCGFDQTCTTNK